MMGKESRASRRGPSLEQRVADHDRDELYHAWTFRGRVPYDPPRRSRHIVERIFTKDREWFECHPGTGEYRWEYVPGEAWPGHLLQGSIIRVRQITPSVRLWDFEGVGVAR